MGKGEQVSKCRYRLFGRIVNKYQAWGLTIMCHVFSEETIPTTRDLLPGNREKYRAGVGFLPVLDTPPQGSTKLYCRIAVFF